MAIAETAAARQIFGIAIMNVALKRARCL